MTETTQTVTPGEPGTKKATPHWVTVLVAAFAGGLFAATATVSTGYLNFSNRDRELDIQLIDISLGILRGEHDAAAAERASVVAARRFAVLTITRLSETTLTEKEISAWAEGAGTPFFYPKTLDQIGFQLE